MSTERCIDCDKSLPACSYEGVLRCSCGIPAEVCICAGDTEPSAEAWKEKMEAKMNSLAASYDKPVCNCGSDQVPWSAGLHASTCSVYPRR